MYRQFQSTLICDACVLQALYNPREEREYYISCETSVCPVAVQLQQS